MSSKTADRKILAEASTSGEGDVVKVDSPAFIDVKDKLDTTISDQGLVIAEDVGVDAFKMKTKIFTPDSVVDAISLFRSSYDPQDFAMSVPLQDTGKCWVSLPSSTGTYTPTLNHRTAYMLNLYQTYISGYVYKVVCKIAFNSDVKFWVQYNPTGTITEAKAGNGFEWSPTSSNQIYVHVPYASVKKSILTTDDITAAVGTLSITPLTDFIMGTAGEDPIVNVFGSTHNVKMFNPKVFVGLPSDPLETYAVTSTAPLSFNGSLYLATDPVTVEKDTVTSDVGHTLIGTKTVIDSIKPALIFEKQIDDFSYNTKNIFGQLDMGVMDVTSAREQTHWQYVKKLPLNDPTGIYNVEIKVKDVISTPSFANFNKYALYTGTVNIKLDAASSPAFQALYRVAQVYGDDIIKSIDDVFQLPGFDWDPKENSAMFKLTWDYHNSMRFTDLESVIAKFSIATLNTNGTSDMEPQIAIMVNTKDLSYNVMKTMKSVAAYRTRVRESAIKRSPLVFEKQIKRTCEVFTDPKNTPGSTLIKSSSSSETVGLESITTGLSAGNTDEATNVPIIKSQMVDEGATADNSRSWSYLTSINFDKDVQAKMLKIDSAMLGYPTWHEVLKYKRFRGQPIFKCNIIAPMTVASQVVVAPYDGVTKTSVQAIARAYPKAIGKADGSVVFTAPWSVETPYLNTDPTANDSDMGYLLVSMLDSFTDWFHGGETVERAPITVAIYVDASNITFNLPKPFVNADYPTPVPLVVPTSLVYDETKFRAEQVAY